MVCDIVACFLVAGYAVNADVTSPAGSVTISPGWLLLREG